MDVFEDPHAGKGFDDFEDFPDLGLEMHEDQFAVSGLEFFLGFQDDANASAAEVIDFGQVQSDQRGVCGQDRIEFVFQDLVGLAVDLSGRCNDIGPQRFLIGADG